MRKVELIDHNGNKNRAVQKLGISRRQVDRLIIIYKEKGKSGFVHFLFVYKGLLYKSPHFGNTIYRSTEFDK